MTTAIRTATAVGYFRVSTQGQAGERHVSLEVQQDAFTKYCQAHQVLPLSTFTDVASGRKDNRVQYQAMLRYIVDHKVASVVVLFLDRFGRRPREILRRYWELEEKGIKVESINEDLKEELMLLMRAGIAGQESKRTGERVKASLYKAATKGVHVGRTPYGYIRVKEGSKERWDQVPEEVQALRLAYRLAVDENMGYKRIANELNLQGYRGKAGTLFTSEVVKSILTNPALKGQMVFGKGQQDPVVRNSVYDPPVLSADEWDKLQERLRVRRESGHRARTNVSTYLLSGIARCGHCGGAMVGNLVERETYRYRYYVCANHSQARALCQTRNIHRQEALEQAVLEYLQGLTDPDAVREAFQRQDVQVDSRQEQELARATARLTELGQAFLNDLERVDRGILNESEYMMRQEVRRQEQVALAARKTALETELANARDNEARVRAAPAKIQSFLETFLKADVVKAKGELQLLLKALHVFRDKDVEVEFR